MRMPLFTDAIALGFVDYIETSFEKSAVVNTLTGEVLATMNHDEVDGGELQVLPDFKDAIFLDTPPKEYVDSHWLNAIPYWFIETSKING